MGGGTENILGETLVEVPNFILAILQMGKVSPTWDHTPGTLWLQSMYTFHYTQDIVSLYLFPKL